jgi:CheY-like chemotaxis protein
MTQRRVVVVEDNRELGDSVVEVLEMLDLETELIRDGALAVERIVATLPALVLLDIHLPGKSGLEILDDIRSDTRLVNTRVVIVSADALRAETVRDKADFILLKPYTIAQLSDLATRLIPLKS